MLVFDLRVFDVLMKLLAAQSTSLGHLSGWNRTSHRTKGKFIRRLAHDAAPSHTEQTLVLCSNSSTLSARASAAAVEPVNSAAATADPAEIVSMVLEKVSNTGLVPLHMQT